MKRLAIALGLLFCLSAIASAQVIAPGDPPSPIGGCYNSTEPTIPSGQAGCAQIDGAGNLKTSSAPSGAASAALSHGTTSALGTSLLAKATAGNLYGFYCNAITGVITAGSSYCIAYNAAAVPSTGALVGAQVLDVCVITTSAGCSLSRIPMGVNYGTGIVILLTSAATPFTYTTGTNTGFISADFK